MGHKKPNPGQRGIWKSKKNQDDPDVKVVDTSYTSEKLAKMVAKAWKDTGFRDSLVGSAFTVNQRAANAKAHLEPNPGGILLDKVIVITEDEYDAGWQQDDENEVVLVLPNRDRVETSASETDLLETARLLMACVPNGI